MACSRLHVYLSVNHKPSSKYTHQSPVTGEKYEVLTSVCGWNQSWVPGVLDPCVATSCQYIPFPPPHLNMRYVPDEENR